MPVSRHNRVKGRDRTEKRHRAALRRVLKRQQALAATEKMRRGETVSTAELFALGPLARLSQKLGLS